MHCDASEYVPYAKVDVGETSKGKKNTTDLDLNASDDKIRIHHWSGKKSMETDYKWAPLQPRPDLCHLTAPLPIHSACPLFLEGIPSEQAWLQAWFGI